jgi:hypothetical protein
MTATVAAKPTKQPKPLRAPNSDFYEVCGTFGLCAGTEDKKEGTSAFLERRAPQFRGR